MVLPFIIRGIGGFPHGLEVKNPPAVQETQVRSLGWEDFLEEEIRIGELLEEYIKEIK